MKVWIVRGDDWNDDGVRAVCATEEIARAELDRLRAEDPNTLLDIEAFDVISAQADG